MSGVRVIDVGNFLAGPYAASIMGEFGAEVLKVEHPIAGDPMRHFGTPTKRHDATLAWLSEARNKKSVTIDLRQKRGVELFIRLVAKSDVLVENFRPGTMEEWGLGWPVLHAGQPRPGHAARLRLRPDRALPPPPRLRAHRPRHRRPLLPRGLSRRDAGGSRHGAARRLHLQPLRRDRRDAGAAPQGGDRARPGDRRRHLRGGVPADGRARRRLRPVRQGARTRGLGQLRRRAARPLPHQGRQVGGDRLHHRQDVRAPVGGDGAAGAGLAPALRRAAQAAGGARRGQRDRRRVGRLRSAATR